MRNLLVILVMFAMLASGVPEFSPDLLVQSAATHVEHQPKDAAGTGGAEGLALQADECHTCTHVTVPGPATHAIQTAAMVRWQIGDEEWGGTAPQAETPPPRMIGNEASKHTSIPTIEVNHVSLCTDRVDRDPGRFGRTS
jgi:hypothetical protein